MIHNAFCSLTVADVRFVLVVHVDGFCPSATGSSALRGNTSLTFKPPVEESFKTDMWYLKVPCYAHFHIHLFWVSPRKMFTCFCVQKIHYVCHAVSFYSTSIHPVSESACLFKALLLTRPACSDWSALTGLSRHHPPCFCISSFCDHSRAGGGDHHITTSWTVLPGNLTFCNMGPLNFHSKQHSTL